MSWLPDGDQVIDHRVQRVIELVGGAGGGGHVVGYVGLIVVGRGRIMGHCVDMSM